MSNSYPALRVTMADGSTKVTSPTNLKSLIANARTFQANDIAKIERGMATAVTEKKADSISTIEEFEAEETVFTNQKLNKMLLNKDAVSLARIKQAELEAAQAELKANKEEAELSKNAAAEAEAKAAAAQTELDEMKKILEQVQSEKAAAAEKSKSADKAAKK